MCKEGELCDVRIQVESSDECLPAHRCVLAAASPYFRAMFTVDLAESWKHSVTIAGVDFAVMEAVMSFAYSAETTITTDRLLDLMMAADLFQMDSLLQHCCSYLQSQLTPHNALSTRAYAHLHRCWKLYKSCEEYILTNFRCIAETNEFLEMPSDVLEDIVANDCLRVRCEEEVYNAVKRWVYYDIPNRRCFFQSLMQHVRLPFVSRQFLHTEVQNEKLMHDCEKYFLEAVCYKTSPNKRAEMKDSVRIQPRKPFGLNEVIMIIGGMSKIGSMDSIDQYDSRTDSWTMPTSSPVPRYGTAACMHNGLVYVTGGSNENQRFINRMDVYNLVERNWKRVANLPIAKRYSIYIYGLQF